MQYPERIFTDPVCGMRVDPARSGVGVTIDGTARKHFWQNGDPKCNLWPTETFR